MIIVALNLIFIVLALLVLSSYVWGNRSFFNKDHEQPTIFYLTNPMGILTAIVIVWKVFAIRNDSMLVPLFADTLLIASLSLYWMALRTHKIKLTYSFVDDTPTHIVTSGPYKNVRHPFYTSYLITYLAVSIYTLDLFVIGLSIFWVVFYYWASYFEEKKFANKEIWRALKDKEGLIQAHEKKFKTTEYRLSLLKEQYSEGIAKLIDIAEMEAELKKSHADYLAAVSDLNIQRAYLEAATSSPLNLSAYTDTNP